MKDNLVQAKSTINMIYRICFTILVLFSIACSPRRPYVESGTGLYDYSPSHSLVVDFSKVQISDSSLIITGTVIDIAYNDSLVGVNLYIADSKYGKVKYKEITDIDGFFKLQSDNSSLSDSLFVSYVGYRDIKFALSDIKNKYSDQNTSNSGIK
jgi:hypothetical protein